MTSTPPREPVLRARGWMSGGGWELNLHDGVQNDRVWLIVKLGQAKDDRDTPPALASRCPSSLPAPSDPRLPTRDRPRDLPVGTRHVSVFERALRAQTRRASVDVTVVGTAPRSTDDAEPAAFFSCSDAIQNVAKHARRATQVTLRLSHARGVLAVCVQDDGRGLDPARTENGAGPRNIRERIRTLGWTVELDSNPGCAPS